MPNDAFSQQRLAEDKNFQLRVRNALAAVAWQILNESTGTTNHTQRAAYARTILGDLETYTPRIARSLVTRPNVMNFATAYDFQRGAVVSATGDPDLESQLSTDWNQLAGNGV